MESILRFVTKMSYSIISMYIIACLDTPSWKDEMNFTCEDYNTWCENGNINAGSEWITGPHYNSPEKNCCICGKFKKGGN